MRKKAESNLPWLTCTNNGRSHHSSIHTLKRLEYIIDEHFEDLTSNPQYSRLHSRFREIIQLTTKYDISAKKLYGPTLYTFINISKITKRSSVKPDALVSIERWIFQQVAEVQ